VSIEPVVPSSSPTPSSPSTRRNLEVDTSQLRPRHGATWGRLRPLIVLAALVGIWCFTRALHGGFVDLAVYRFGGVAVLDGPRLYAEGTPGTGLPFTYPPFSALAMVPLVVLPFALLVGMWNAATVVVLGLVIDRFLRVAQPVPVPPVVLAAVTAGALAFEPVWSSLAFGQINIFLMALVAFDLLRSDRRHAGWMIGVAAGLKLTPLLFLVFLLLIGRFRAARTGALAFLGTIGVGFVLAPGASWTYWTSLLWDAGRVGGVAYSGNQSVMGVLYRVTGHEPGTVVWFLIAGSLASLTLLVAALTWRRGRPELAVCTAALAMLLASPISWSHHWVWAVPLVLALWPVSRVVAVLTTALFASSVIWVPPRTEMRELAWTPFEQVYGNSYLIAALLLAAYVGWVALRRTSR
jgi:alpha-1,2-mannosyltransferase